MKDNVLHIKNGLVGLMDLVQKSDSLNYKEARDMIVLIDQMQVSLINDFD